MTFIVIISFKIEILSSIGFRPLRRAGKRAVPRQGPNDFSFLRKRKAFWISKEKVKPHRQGAIFYSRRPSGYSQRSHRTLPLLSGLKNCQHPHWAAAAPPVGAPAALGGGGKPSKQHRAAAAERGALIVVRPHGGNRRQHYADGLLFLWKSKRLFFFAKKKSRLALRWSRPPPAALGRHPRSL